MSDDIKQVIVMRNDLGMRKGKMIAQGAHAAMKFITDRLSFSKDEWRDACYPNGTFSRVETRWMETGFTKICVRVDSEEELLALVDEAREAGLRAKVIKDSGKTEFDGVPTITSCAIGPDRASKIDEITGHLKLL